MFLNLFLNNASQGLQFGSRWLLNLFLLTLLTTASFADFTFVYALANILLSVFPFGSSVFIINTTSNNKEALLKSLTIINLFFFVSLILYIIVFLIFRDWSALNYIWLGLVLAYALSLNLVLFSYYKSISNFIIEVKAYFGFSLLLLFGFVALYYLNDNLLNIYSVFLILILSNILIFIYASNSVITYKELLKIETFQNFKDLVYNLKLRLYFGFQEIVTAIYTQSGMLILYYLLTNETYKTYKALFIIVAPFFMFSVAFAQVMLNKIKRLETDRLLRVFRKIQIITFCCSLLLSLIVYSLKNIVFLSLEMDLTQENITSFYLIILILNIRFIFANYEILFIVLNKQPIRFYIMLFSAVFNIISTFVLVPLYGLLGAIYVYLLSYLMVLIGLVLIGEFILIRRLNRRLSF